VSLLDTVFTHDNDHISINVHSKTLNIVFALRYIKLKLVEYIK